MWKGWKEEVGQQEWRAFMAGQTCPCGWWEIAGECPDWIVGVWVGPRGCVYTGVYRCIHCECKCVVYTGVVCAHCSEVAVP